MVQWRLFLGPIWIKGTRDESDAPPELLDRIIEPYRDSSIHAIIHVLANFDSLLITFVFTSPRRNLRRHDYGGWILHDERYCKCLQTVPGRD